MLEIRTACWRRSRSFDWTERLGNLATVVARLGLENTILDGEVVAIGPDGTTSFQSLQNAFREGRGDQLTYYVFDVLYLDRHDLRNLPLIRRKALLKKVVRSVPRVLYVDHIEEHGRAFFDLVSGQALEGIVGKNKQSPYVSGRETWHWLKIKNRRFERKEPVEFKTRARKR